MHRRADTIYLNVPDPSQPFGYSPLARFSASLRPLVTSGQHDVFKKMWDGGRTRMMHH